MKRKAFVSVLIVVFFVLGFFALVVETAQADCSSHEVWCKVKGDKKVGTHHFGYCWSWSNFECDPCHGKAYFAKWCNENHEEKCKGECWGCVREWVTYVHEEHCYDKHGNRHDPKNRE